MRRTTKLAVCWLGATLLLVTGCQKLNITKTVNVGPEEYKSLRIPAQKKDQKIQVAVNSADADITVSLVVGIDPNTPDTVIEELLQDKAKYTVAAEKKQVREATLEGTMPAGTEAAVVFAPSKKATDVSIKITGD
jgi:hypothetical protein